MMGYFNTRMLKYIFILFCTCNVSVYWNSCFAGNFSLRLVADSETSTKRDDSARTSNFPVEKTTKWYSVSNKISAEVKQLQNITTRQKEGRLEILLHCSKDDITWKDIAMVRDSLDHNGLPMFELLIKDNAQDRLFNFTKQNKGKYFAEVVNDEVVFVPKIQAPFSDYISLCNVSQDQLNDIQFQHATPVLYFKDVDYPIRLTIRHLLIFMFCIVVLILNLIPTKGMPRKKTPRIWIIIFAVVSGILCGYYFGVSHNYGSFEMMKKYNAEVRETHITLVNLFLGAIAGAFLGIICSYPAWYLLRRAIFNAGRLFTRFIVPKKAESRTEEPRGHNND